VQTCFVIMPFGNLFDRYYERVYRLAIVDAGLEAQRADEIFYPRSFHERRRSGYPKELHCFR
jgi:hypothetical protein